MHEAPVVGTRVQPDRARLGLNDWKGAVRDKLKTVDDIYRLAVERAAIVRREFLELTIVVLIVLEFVLLTD